VNLDKKNLQFLTNCDIDAEMNIFVTLMLKWTSLWHWCWNEHLCDIDSEMNIFVTLILKWTSLWHWFWNEHHYIWVTENTYIW